MACSQGLLEIHSLHRYFDRELLCPPVESFCNGNAAPGLGPLQWTGQLLRWFDIANSLCLPNFDTDFSQAFPGLCEAEMQVLLRSVFDHLDAARPGATLLHVNLGASVDQGAASCAHALLDLLDEGATRTNPFVVLRIREGVNLHPHEPLFSITQKALDLSRRRQGIAFGLMDSGMNREWLEFVAYAGDGLRMEPLHGDLFRGVRGTSVNGIVTLNVPPSHEADWPKIERSLHLAGRVLAQKLELMEDGKTGRVIPGTSVINISGLSFDTGASKLASFDLLEKIDARVAQMGLDFGLPMTVAIVESLDGAAGQPYVSSGLSLAAELQHKLRGGHSLVIPTGSHMSWQDLHLSLCAAQAAGLSFLRFSPEDVRCGSCHLAVAAAGPCPACAYEGRRRVDFVEGRLQSLVTGEPIV
jgi:hypothetical protein